MKLRYRCSGSMLVCVCLVLLMGSAATAEDFSPFDPAKSPVSNVDPAQITSKATTLEKSGDRALYQGEVILFIVEPVSNHWRNNHNNEFYKMAFLDYALRQNISITETDTFETTVEWYSPDHGFPYIEEDNIAVVGGVYNAVGHPAYSNPPTGNQFTAHYSDAAAEASPGNPGSNKVEPGFSHSIIAEEGTATWCGYCPWVMDALANIYASEDYPFHYVALVDDKGSTLGDYLADVRLQTEFNIAGFPTTYIDGGHQVRVGGSASSETTLRTAIQNSGMRSVTGLVMQLDVEYIGTYELRVHVKVYQGDASNQAPTQPATPTGDAYCVAEMDYSCTATGTDPDGDDVYFKWDFDGTETAWYGPHPSGTELTGEHSFGTEGTKEVRVKIKDDKDVESQWSDPLTVEANACGDANDSGAIDIDDVVFIIAYVFQGGTAPIPAAAGDTNCSGAVDIDDIVFEIAYVFQGGAAPCSTCQ